MDILAVLDERSSSRVQLLLGDSYLAVDLERSSGVAEAHASLRETGELVLLEL